MWPLSELIKRQWTRNDQSPRPHSSPKISKFIIDMLAIHTDSHSTLKPTSNHLGFIPIALILPEIFHRKVRYKSQTSNSTYATHTTLATIHTPQQGTRPHTQRGGHRKDQRNTHTATIQTRFRMSHDALQKCGPARQRTGVARAERPPHLTAGEL